MVEVSPRDGLQNERAIVSTAHKLALIERDIAAGARRIEVTSFVNPRAVPQMADADIVMETAVSNPTYNHVNFIGLVFNQRGYDRALAAGCRAMAFGVAVSDTFSQRNTRRTSQEAFATTQKLVARAKRDGIWTRVYVMTAWVCPFEGVIIL